ncbi:hypothetical protein [Bdellovibrio sp.]|uniref:hypothetical protein n=1 Tax=Bdellovibrio sp. TaxID=28201 RepID=UPI0039E29F18
MKRLIISLVFGVSLTSHAELSVDQRIEKLQKGVDQGSVEWVREAFDGVKDPFKKGRGGLFGEKAGVFGEYNPEYFLEKAFVARPCKDEVALIILQNGAEMSMGALFEKAYQGGCAKTVEYLIETKSSASVAQGAISFFNFYGKKVSQVVRSKTQGYHESEDTLDKWDPIQVAFEDFVMKKCPDRTKSSPECKARSAFDDMSSNISSEVASMKKAVAKKEVDDAYMESSDGLALQLCEVEGRINEAKAQIERQRKIGKVSGTVDMAVLNRAGTRVVDLEDERKSLVARFKKVTGKSFNRVVCK